MRYFHFCSHECKEKFQQNPKQFIKEMESANRE